LLSTLVEDILGEKMFKLINKPLLGPDLGINWLSPCISLVDQIVLVYPSETTSFGLNKTPSVDAVEL
jgi:hypothetical protein